MSVIVCVDRSTLQEFFAARLSRERFDQVAAHVEICETCQAALETLPSAWPVPDPSADVLATHSEDQIAVATGIQELISRLIRLPQSQPAPSGSTRVLEPGVVIDDFIMEQRLGVGSFGEVWRASDLRLRRTVAIKFTRNMDSKAVGNDLVREARAAAQLDHPAIVRVFDVGNWQQSVYIVTEFVAGLSLQVASQGTRWTARQAAECCETLARGLDHAHSRGIIHRDLKPGNVLMDPNSQPHILDFGLARLENEQTIAMEGWLLGTVAYMSPEQARAQAHLVGPESDIYSLGVMLFELLTGERPFRGDRESLLAQTINVTAPKARSLSQNIPKDLDTICAKCLEKEPRLRFRSAAELAEELKRYLNHQPIRSRPVGIPGTLWRWCLRKPLVAALSSVVVLTVLIASVLVTWSWRDERTAKRVAHRRLRSAEEAITDLVQLAEGIRELPGGQQRGHQLLERVIDHYRQMTDAALPTDPTQQMEVARVWLKLAEMEQSRNEFVAARHAAENAQAIFKPLTQQSSERIDAQWGLASVRQRFGLLHSAAQQYALAIEEFEAGRNLLRQLTEPTAQPLNQHVTLDATLLFELGIAQLGAQQFGAAERSLQQSHENWKTLGSRDASNRLARLNQINALRGLGRIRNATRQVDAAAESIHEALRLAQMWNESEPDDAELVELHSSTLLDVADVARRRGQYLEERSQLTAARERLQRLLQLENYSPRVQLELTLTITQLAQLQHRAGWNQSAKELIEDAWDRASELSALFPQVPMYSQTFAICSDIQGEILLALDEAERAAELHRTAIGHFQTMLRDAPDVPDLQQRLAICHSHLGQALGRRQQYEESQAAFATAIGMLDQLTTNFRDPCGYRESLADVVMEAGLAAATRHSADAKPLLERAIRIRQELQSDSCSSPQNLRQWVWLMASSPLVETRHTQQVLELADRLWVQERGQEPGLCISALALFRAGQQPEARARLREQLELVPEAAECNRLLTALLLTSANDPASFQTAWQEGAKWQRAEAPAVFLFEQLRREVEQAAKDVRE